MVVINENRRMQDHFFDVPFKICTNRSTFGSPSGFSSAKLITNITPCLQAGSNSDRVSLA